MRAAYLQLTEKKTEIRKGQRKNTNIEMGKLTNFHHLAFVQRFEINHLRSVKKRLGVVRVLWYGKCLNQHMPKTIRISPGEMDRIEMPTRFYITSREIAAQLAN